MGIGNRTHRVGSQPALSEAFDQERHKVWVVFDEKHPH
jgi:hypothetical protein